MINAPIFSSGLYRHIERSGHWLKQVDGAWVSSDDVAVQAIIDTYSLSTCQREITDQIDAHAKALRDSVVSTISPAEMASWGIKQREAAAYTASGMDADAPMLANEAQARGVATAALAAMVLTKAQQLAALEAMIAGVAGKHGDAVKATTTFDAALAYDWRTGWPL
jgi:hypothetical protein